MAATATTTTSETGSSRIRSAPTGLSLAAASYVLAVVMVGTTMPTPLYPLYQDAFGFGSAVTTVLFAIYAGGVILSLVLFGRLSDALGRRPLLLAGLALSLASAAVFFFAEVEWLLFVGRVLSGLAAGILTATGTVVVMENAPEGRARLASSLATASNIGGLGLGMLMAGAVAQFTGDSLQSPFLVHAVLLVIGVGALWWVREGGANGERARIQLPRVPTSTRRVFAVAAVGAAAGFAVCGFFSSLVPSFMGEVLGNGEPAAVGLVTFLLFGSSAVAQIALRSRSDRTLIVVGTIALVVSLAVLVLALALSLFAVLVISSIIGGAGQGLMFSGGMRSVTGATAPGEKTEATTSYFLVAYLSISVPSIGAGVLTLSLGLVPVGIGFAVVVAVAALLGLLGVRRFAAS